MEIFDKFLEYWWLVLLATIMPYLILFLSYLARNKKIKKNKRLKSTIVKSDEQIHLGVTIKNTDIKIYKERIENLIVLLNESKERVSVNAVEAILIVELFSDSVLVNERGELVVDVKTAKEFSKEIYHDPMKFITYVKSVENRIDINNPQNKIALGDVLYMMRNAKKFGLYMNEYDSDVVYKIKSAIHESNYKDVVVRFVEDVHKVEQDERLNTNIILNNTHQIETQKNIQEERDEKIKTIEKLDENSRVKITMHDGTIVTKDDFIFYSVEIPEANDEIEKKTQNKSELLTQVLEQANDTTVQEYITRFGGLDMHEQANKDKLLFKDRALKFYDENIFSYKKFSSKDFQTKNFFEGDEKFYHYFLATLFSKEFAINNGQPFVFIGNNILQGGKAIRFVAIDVYYFLVLIYSSIDRADRESFFNFIFDGKKIKEDSLNIFLENIDKDIDFFYGESGSYLYDVIYVYLEKTISTKILNIRIETIEDLFDKSEEIKNAYSGTKRELDGTITVKAFNKAAKKIMITNTKYSHDTFFRLPLEEKYF